MSFAFKEIAFLNGCGRSGGILLKYPGRVGEVGRHGQHSFLLIETPNLKAAIYGAGCWAQQFKQGNIGIACSVSGLSAFCGPETVKTTSHTLQPGTGEYIMRSMLARAVGEAFEKCILEALELDPHAIINQVLSDKLLGKRSS